MKEIAAEREGLLIKASRLKALRELKASIYKKQGTRRGRGDFAYIIVAPITSRTNKRRGLPIH